MAALTKGSKLATHLSRCSKHSICFSFEAHLSTNRDSSSSTRSFRGGPRGRGDDDDTEFGESIDFGSGVNGERSNLSSVRGPNRQWKGDRSFEGPNQQGRRETGSRAGDTADDFYPDSRKGYQVQRGNGPMKEGFRAFGESGKEIQSPVEKSSSPVGERERGGPNWRAKALGGTGETLFEKLRLDEKNPEPDETGPTEPNSLPPPPREAEEIFRKMKETGLIPNAVAMLDGLCKDGLVQEAMKLFGVMREKGTIPEVVIYTAVVEVFCKVPRFEDAIRVFRKMQKNSIVPNAYSYGVIVNGLCKGGRLMECEELCVEMFEAGHSPNPATFVGLVDAFCKANGVEEGKRIVKRFQERNFAIDEKSLREHLDKKGPFEGPVWEAIFGKKTGRRHI